MSGDENMRSKMGDAMDNSLRGLHLPCPRSDFVHGTPRQMNGGPSVTGEVISSWAWCFASGVAMAISDVSGCGW